MIFRTILLCILLAGACMCLSGCTGTDSDLPWNMQQPWEGTPYVPGMSGQ